MNEVVNEAVSATNQLASNKKRLGKILSDWLQIDFSISIFGQTIIEWHYPPLDRR